MLLTAGLGLLLGLSSLSLHAETYTYPQLVSRLTDMEQLALLPPPGETTGLSSSYDRNSRYDAATDQYINWGANADGSGIIRQEGNLSVLAEINGPGCIWRMWSATAAAGGHVKIYLDGSATPVTDLSLIGYFDGKTAPFNRPNLVYILKNAAPGNPPGFDNYTPISFQKSCKIVAEANWGNYYQFTYTKFAPGTIVPTFHMDLSSEDSAALDRANEILGHCGQPAASAPGTQTENQAVKVPAGASAVVADLSGEEAITNLRVKLDLPPDPEAQRVLLRQLVIRITWDGQKDPAVWSPLGDFFAYVGGADTFQSLPVGLLTDGTFYSSWYMPFAKGAKIELVNESDKAVSTAWEVSHAPLTHPITAYGRFHAKWHRDAFLIERHDRVPDWPFLITQGRGRFVGFHLHGWNPRGGWWGEGDDKFFIDGEKFPSTFGTGSEDYFGYAWSSAKHFSEPYHNQILNEGNTGHFDDNRWHIPDSVPFQTSFEGCIEKYFPNDRPTLYAAEAFWYLSPDGTDPYPPVPVADRIGYWKPLDLHYVLGAIEGEEMPVVSPISADAPHPQDMFESGDKWSGDRQLFWDPATTGERLNLGLLVQVSGKYHLLVHLTQSPDYGVFQFYVDGAKAGVPIDLYKAQVDALEPIDLGGFDLKVGRHVLTAELVGKNDASKSSSLGLDYFRLVPQR